MATYSARQQQILTTLGKTMGFAVDALTDVTFQGDIPTNVTYATTSGTYTRSTYSELGSILTNAERDLLKSVNASNVQSAAFLAAQSLLGRNITARASDFIQSAGRLPVNNLAALSSSFDPRTARLASSGLNSYTSNTPTDTPLTTVSFASGGREDRVRISDPTGIFINSSNPVLKPLADVGFVLFPYTPTISMSHTADYQVETPTHSNYSYVFYKNSPTPTISISGVFTAKDATDAAYVLAVQHFFRSVTKMFYGTDSEAGTPPPILRLDGHGDYQFSSVPVIIKDFSINLPNDVDYISTLMTVPSRQGTNASGSRAAGIQSDLSSASGYTSIQQETRVPVLQTFTLTCMPVYSRSSISNKFGVRDFAAGKLLGSSSGSGGFI